jgi:hypothetical protein
VCRLSVALTRISTQPSSAINRMAYMERPVIELSNPYFRENALCELLSSYKEFCWMKMVFLVYVLLETVSLL